MSAYDDYASKIKDALDSLDVEPQPLVPERGNGGIGGRDRSKGKVRVMGAKLDADVAGMQALDAKVPTEEHERLFQAGVKGMRAGEYRAATTAFTQVRVRVRVKVRVKVRVRVRVRVRVGVRVRVRVRVKVRVS